MAFNIQQPSLELEEGLEYVPKLTDFGFLKAEIAINVKSKQTADYSFEGGEDKGLERLDSIFGYKSLKSYESTVGLYHGSVHTSKLSPWIANGSLSVRKVYYAINNLKKTNKYVTYTTEKNIYINKL